MRAGSRARWVVPVRTTALDARGAARVRTMALAGSRGTRSARGRGLPFDYVLGHAGAKGCVCVPRRRRRWQPRGVGQPEALPQRLSDFVPSMSLLEGVGRSLAIEDTQDVIFRGEGDVYERERGPEE